MQSEPTEITQKFPQDSFPATQQSIQHGFNQSHERATSHRRHEYGAIASPHTVREQRASPISLGEEADVPSRWLSSSSSSRTGSPVDRIIEHENATISKSKRQSPVFTVIRRSRRAGGSCVNLTDFPNGNERI